MTKKAKLWLCVALYLTSSLAWGPWAEAALRPLPVKHVTFGLYMNRTPRRSARTPGTSRMPRQPAQVIPQTVSVAQAAPQRPANGSVWDSIAACESGGNWGSTGGSFEGGVQFLHSTWIAAGGRKYAEHAYQASREQQIAIAQSWLARTSWNQWPSCSRRLGLR